MAEVQDVVKPYDPALSFRKAAWETARTVGAAAGVAALTALSSPEAASSLSGIDPRFAVFVPLVQFLAKFALDWLKHRKRG